MTCSLEAIPKRVESCIKKIDRYTQLSCLEKYASKNIRNNTKSDEHLGRTKASRSVLDYWSWCDVTTVLPAFYTNKIIIIIIITCTQKRPTYIKTQEQHEDQGRKKGVELWLVHSLYSRCDRWILISLAPSAVRCRTSFLNLASILPEFPFYYPYWCSRD